MEILHLCLNIFSETAGPIKAKFHVESPWEGGRKVKHKHDQDGCHAHIKYNKTLKIFSRIRSPMIFKLGV